LLLSLSPALFLGLAGLRLAWRERQLPGTRLLLLWFVLGLLLVYAPFHLQRRFMFAIYLPVTGMALLGIEEIRRRFPRGGNLWFRTLLLLSIPTNALVLAAGIFGAASQDARIFLSNDEADALRWISENTARRDLVLCGPEMGSYLPALTGRRVIYGHPFETFPADAEQQAVQEFFAGQKDAGGAWLEQRGIDYILFGPRERALGNPAGLASLPVLFRSGDVLILRGAGSP
jgi:hypothetical protein